MTIVIVGAGQGGYQVAASLRDEGFERRIVLIGDEPSLPYQRPPLSKAFLKGNADETLVLLRPEKFFRDRRIELLRGQHVAGIDRTNKAVVFDSGTRIMFDRLVLATGARNRPLFVPGTNLEGVVQLRCLADHGRIITHNSTLDGLSSRRRQRIRICDGILVMLSFPCDAPRSSQVA